MPGNAALDASERKRASLRHATTTAAAAATTVASSGGDVDELTSEAEALATTAAAASVATRRARSTHTRSHSTALVVRGVVGVFQQVFHCMYSTNNARFTSHCQRCVDCSRSSARCHATPALRCAHRCRSSTRRCTSRRRSPVRRCVCRASSSRSTHSAARRDDAHRRRRRQRQQLRRNSMRRIALRLAASSLAAPRSACSSTSHASYRRSRRCCRAMLRQLREKKTKTKQKTIACNDRICLSRSLVSMYRAPTVPCSTATVITTSPTTVSSSNNDNDNDCAMRRLCARNVASAARGRWASCATTENEMYIDVDLAHRFRSRPTLSLCRYTEFHVRSINIYQYISTWRRH